MLAGPTGTEAFAQILGPQISPAEQWLVLKNGEVLRGQITRNAKQVILHTEQGSRLVLPAERTDFVCNSMVDAYWGKVARTNASDLAGQKRLFHWCLKNMMLEQAQNQIDILLQSNVKAAELEYLDRQLNVAIIQQRMLDRQVLNRRVAQAKLPTPEKPLGHRDSPTVAIDGPSAMQTALEPLAENVPIGIAYFDLKAVPGRKDFRPLPDLNEEPTDAIQSQFATIPPQGVSPTQSELDGSIRQVNFEEEVNETIPIAPMNPLTSGPTASSEVPEPVDDRIMIPVHELDRETRSMPDGTLGHYRQRVERVLTSGCSAAKCHARDSRIMPLFQVSKSQPIPRRQSQRNLHNVLKYVNRVHPFESQLLTAATTPHAGNLEPILEKGSPHHESLIQWLMMLSDDPRQALHEAMEWEQQTSTPDETAPVQPVEPKPDTSTPSDASALNFPETVGEIPKLNTGESAFIPIDPFDPEIFNRKHGK